MTQAANESMPNTSAGRHQTAYGMRVLQAPPTLREKSLRSLARQPFVATLPLERRQRHRVSVPCMYSLAILHAVSHGEELLEGHVLNLGTGGIAVEIDFLLPIGDTVILSFRVPGLGTLHDGQWPEFTLKAVVVRHEGVEDFPGGPYKIALRFAPVPARTQKIIAQYIQGQASMKKSHLH